MRTALEAALSIAVDTLYPPSRLAEVVGTIQRDYPTVSLDVRTGTLSAVVAQVHSGDSHVGITGMSELPPELVPGPCDLVELIAVAAPQHPLHALKGAASDEALREHTNIVLSAPAKVDEQGPQTHLEGKIWRINDSEARRTLVCAGLGWARLPRHPVEKDLEERVLLRQSTTRWKRKNTVVPLRTIYRRDHPPGPAGCSFLERISAAH